MAVTSPDNIAYPDGGSTSSWKSLMAAMATSIQDALTKRFFKSYGWADSTARAAQAGMGAGDKGTQADTGVTYRYNGSAWKVWESDWIAYLPTLTGITIGTGGAATNTASYKYEDGRLRVKGVATMGTSGASVSGSIGVTLPVTAAALPHAYAAYDGIATFFDTSATTNYFAFVCASNASVTAVQLLSPGTNGLRVGSTGSVPFTWAAGDSASYDFVCDPA